MPSPCSPCIYRMIDEEIGGEFCLKQDELAIQRFFTSDAFLLGEIPVQNCPGFEGSEPTPEEYEYELPLDWVATTPTKRTTSPQC